MKSFSDRVNFACAALIQNKNGRDVDDCYECDDSAMVVVSIWRRAIQSPTLWAAMHAPFSDYIKNHGAHPWQETVEKYQDMKDKDIPGMASQLRAMATKRRSRLESGMENQLSLL